MKAVSQIAALLLLVCLVSTTQAQITKPLEQQPSEERPSEQPTIADLRLALQTHAEQGEYAEAAKMAVELRERLPDQIGLHVTEGELHYMAANMEAAIGAFDRAIEMDERIKPRLWQRGLALYYAERYEEGAEQFVNHKTVNAQDVENAVWHFACLAKAESVQIAKQRYMDIDQDSRVPMQQIHQMFKGESTDRDVLEATLNADADEMRRSQFYAHFYIGLYFEVIGEEEKSIRHIELASRIDSGLPNHLLMSQVANVHRKIRGKAEDQE